MKPPAARPRGRMRPAVTRRLASLAAAGAETMRQRPFQLAVALGFAALAALAVRWTSSRSAVRAQDEATQLEKQIATGLASLNQEMQQLLQRSSLASNNLSTTKPEAEYDAIDAEFKTLQKTVAKYQSESARAATLRARERRAMATAGRAGQVALAVGPTSVALAGLIFGLHQRQLILRMRAGLCVKCGYDVRATPARCPECGAAPASAVGCAPP